MSILFDIPDSFKKLKKRYAAIQEANKASAEAEHGLRTVAQNNALYKIRKDNPAASVNPGKFQADNAGWIQKEPFVGNEYAQEYVKAKKERKKFFKNK